MGENTDLSYAVLSPWAEADPIPFRGINARLNDLAGKKIGLYCNTKRVADPTLKVIEERLKKQYKLAGISWFYAMVPNLVVTEQKDRKEEFEKWLGGVDAVIAAYGD
jgi:hypothetical protein